MKSFLLGLILGLAALPVAAYVYFKTGTPPVAVADTPFPMEREIVHVPLEARLIPHAQEVAPIPPSTANLATGAHIYRDQCAVCHGVYGHPSSIAKHMYPSAPQLWEKHRNGAVGVSDDPPGETYWKVANGIRLTGMPSFNKLLNSTQIWQVTLLLSGANHPLPEDVLGSMGQPPGLKPDTSRKTLTHKKAVPVNKDAVPVDKEAVPPNKEADPAKLPLGQDGQVSQY